MTLGAGKYDRFSTAIQQATDADAVIVMVVGGHLGEGFSITARVGTDFRAVAQALRVVAVKMEADADTIDAMRKAGVEPGVKP